MEIIVTFLILVAIVALVAMGDIVLVVQQIKTRRLKSPKITVVKEVDEFPATQRVMGVDGLAGIAIDELNKKLCLVLDGGVPEQSFRNVVGYGDILAVEVFEDTVPSQGVSTNRILRVELHIIVKSTSTPTHTIVFLERATFANTAEHRNAMKQARHWHGVLQAAADSHEIHAAREQEQESASALPVHSVADELRKLAQLRDEGVLTEQEFQQQKNRLLA